MEEKLEYGIHSLIKSSCIPQYLFKLVLVDLMTWMEKKMGNGRICINISISYIYLIYIKEVYSLLYRKL